jgi:hypothetical protein
MPTQIGRLYHACADDPRSLQFAHNPLVGPHHAEIEFSIGCHELHLFAGYHEHGHVMDFR